MGNGRLKRIAALTSLATTAVMVAGVVNVPALAGLEGPTLTTTVPTTTVPSTTVTVPSTPVTPTTTVTTPTVTTPKAPSVSAPEAPAPPTPTVKTPTVKAPSGSTSGGTSGGSGSGGGGRGGGGTTITQQTSTVLDTVSGVTSGGSTTNTVSGAKGTVGGAAGGGSAGGGTAGGTNPALQALSAFDGGGGPGGTAGPGGGGSGGGTFGGSGGRSGGLPSTLSAAGAKHLRVALDLLAECMSAIAPIDRQVLSMRAGRAGGVPLSRPQVASQLGVSTRQVRLSERRGLSGLRVAAEQTGCAGPVGGPFAVSSIGPLQLTVAATSGVVTTGTPAASADGGGSGYVPARQAEPGAESPLARLTGNGGTGPAWLVVIVTVLLSVSIAGLLRELRDSVGA